MKNLIIIAVFISGIFNMNAQEIIVKKENHIKELQEGAYYKLDPEYLKKYKGIWLSEDEKFKVFITTQKIFLEGPNVYMEKLVGKYCIISFECQFELNPFSLKGGSIDYKNGITARFLFSDEKKNKLGTAKLKLIEGNKGIWTLTNREGIRVGNFDYSFSVPVEMVMNKIE